MSRYLCCSCICSSSKKKNNSNRDSDNPSVSMSNNSPLHDLMENPTQVDENVEYKIGKWQQAIIDFENLEVQLMMKLPVEGPAIISNLREHPSEHLSHPLELVRSLAKQRLEVLKIEGSLPSKRKVKKPNPRPSITNDANKFDDMFTNDSPHVGFYTERLSQIWSTRINTMDSTQGVISMADNELNKKAELFVRPKWPDFLTDVSYEVLKINKYGHQMRRILKLTQSHVVSIKNGNEVTKFYHYLDIRRVGLRKGNHIYVLQRSGKKNLYLTPIAPHILQQLTTRIQVRRSLDRAFVGGQGLDGDDAVYDLETAAEMIRAIAEENAADVDSVMTHFATSLRERTIRSLSTELRSTPFRHAPQTLNSAPPSKSTEEPTQEDVASNPLFDEDKETESAMLSTQSTFDGPERSWSDNVVNDPVADSEAISESMSEAKPECEPEVLDETVPVRGFNCS